MAGDSLTVHASSWYAGGSSTPGTPVSPLTDLVTALANSVPGAAGGKMISSQLGTTVLSPSITGFLSSRDAGNVSTQPKSYLNIVVLDEQLIPVITNDGKNSYFEQVGSAGGTSVKQYNILKRPVTKSGYVYVYVSNETPNIDVYWDNLKVTQSRGKLAAEEGYYPFGLAMNALSSHAGAVANNAYKYNGGTELTEDFDVDYYETYLRQYDAQIGRFTGVDVLSEATFSFTPYHYGANDPVFFNDPSGAVFVKPGPQPSDIPTLPEVVVTSTRYTGSGTSMGWMDFGWMFSYTGMGINYGGGGVPSGSGPGGGGGNYSYTVSQWGNGSDRKKDPQTNSSGGGLNKLYFEHNHSGSQTPSELALYTFNKDYNTGASLTNDDENLYTEAQRLKDYFIHGKGNKQDLGTGAIARHIMNSTNFKSSTEKFESATREYYNDNKTLEGYDGDFELKLDKPDKFTPKNSELALTTVMGGWHQITANVMISNGQLTFNYTIYDVFGAGDDDAIKFYYPGLPSLYFLQNFGMMPGMLFIPFIWTVTVPSPNP